jgi:type II secretory pathway component PulC
MKLLAVLLFAATAQAAADEDILIAPAADCRSAVEKKWMLTTESKLADVLKALADLTCDRFILSRSMAATKVMVDVGSDTLSTYELRRRVEGALRAKGIVVESTSALRVRKAGDLEPPPPSSRTLSSQAVGPERLDKEIQCVEKRCTLTRAVRDAILADTDGLARSARIVPYYRDGKVLGMKLFGIRPGSYYSRLGILNGDAILSIDGMDIASPEKALEVYSRVARKSSLKIEIERRGQPVTMEYVVK